MSQTTTIVFIDTNVLLHCRALPELDWGLLPGVGTGPVEIVIARTVQTEIDRLKHDGNAKRAKRARAANRVFRGAIKAPDERIDILTGARQVTLKLSADSGDGQTRRPDDELVLEVKRFAAAHANDRVLFVTDDTGPALTAKRLNLAVEWVPDDWKLQEEVDPREKELVAKDRRIAQLESSMPKIEVQLATSVDPSAPIERLNWEVAKYQPIAPADLDALCAAVAAQHPLVTHFPKPAAADRDERLPGSYWTWDRPAEDAIRAYGAAHGAWMTKVRSRFSSLARDLNDTGRIMRLALQLRNVGGAPCEGLLVEIAATPPFQLVRSTSADSYERLFPGPRLPKPPVPPDWRRGARFAVELPVLSRSSLTDMHRFFEPPALQQIAALRRDPHEIYSELIDDADAPRVEFVCADFRHDGDPRELTMFLQAPPADGTVRGALKIKISMRNSPDVIRRVVPLEISTREESALSIARYWALASEDEGSD